MKTLFDAFIATLLMICVACSGNPTTVRHSVGYADQPQLPDETLERFKDCGERIQPDLKPGQIPIDARIKVDQDGHVFDATTTGEPNQQVGMCLRHALRDMRVDPEVIEQAKRRAQAAAKSSGPGVSTLPSRHYFGQVEVVEVVTMTITTIVYIDVFINLSAVVLVVGVVAVVYLAADAAVDAVQAASTSARKPHQPVADKWTSKGGTIRENADGSRTFTRADGVSVTYNPEGYPDFTPYRHPTVKDVQIEFSGERKKDFRLADEAAGITEKKRKDEFYTWHHHQDGKTMQLIKRDVHGDFFHTGGMAGTRKEIEECNSNE